jgi:hypothetical protein
LLADLFSSRQISYKTKQSSGLLCLDACVSPMLQSILDGSDFILQETHNNGNLKKEGRHFHVDFEDTNISNNDYTKAQVIFVNSDVPSKVVNDLCFSTRVGSEEDIKQFGFFGKVDYEPEAHNYIRGIYCPFLGTNSILSDNTIYNIKQKGYSASYLKEYFKVRGNDQAPFYAISDRFSLDDLNNKTLDVYRGDCYTNTVTFRLNRNFIDSSVPINDIIIDSQT